MDGWPDDWFRNDAPRRPGEGSRGPGGERGASGEPTAHIPHAGTASQSAASRSGAAAGARAGWSGPRRRGPRIVKIIAAIVALLLIAAIGMYFFLDARLNRVPVLAGYPGRPTGSAGQNWLITGSDSRQGLTRQQENQLATGHDVTGQRSDTIMLLHMGGGTPTLVSLPRDLYVNVPGQGMNKLNAAFALGGPKLLAETVQNYTGLRVDHYMGIGLGYVRDRHSFGASDLQRVQDQRAFLKALLSKATSPAVFLNPFAAIPTATSSASALSVDQGTHMYQLLQVAFALRGPQTTTVPLAGSESTGAGDVLLTDHARALQLFNALGSDQPIPRSLLSGTSGA